MIIIKTGWFLGTFKELCCYFVMCRMPIPQASWIWSWINKSGSDHLLQPGPVHRLVLLVAPGQSPTQQPGLRVGTPGWSSAAPHAFLKSWFIMVCQSSVDSLTLCVCCEPAAPVPVSVLVPAGVPGSPSFRTTPSGCRSIWGMRRSCLGSWPRVGAMPTSGSPSTASSTARTKNSTGSTTKTRLETTGSDRHKEH